MKNLKQEMVERDSGLKALAQAVREAGGWNDATQQLLAAVEAHDCAAHYDEPAETNRADNAEAERDKLRAALTKINAIRDSIVGAQGFNFSEHAYPLVAALEEAGYEGAGYGIASANLGTLIEQRDTANLERDVAVQLAATANAQLKDALDQRTALADALAAIRAADKLGYGDGPSTLRMAANREADVLLAERRGDGPTLQEAAAKRATERDAAQVLMQNALKAMDVLMRYGQIDGSHHKAWVIDQAVRALAGAGYATCIQLHCAGEDGPQTYSWDVGVPP